MIENLFGCVVLGIYRGYLRRVKRADALRWLAKAADWAIASFGATRVVQTDSRLEVHPAAASGFVVGLDIADDEPTVFFHDWHQRCTTEAEVFDWLRLGLTERCRLTVTYADATPIAWSLEVAGEHGRFAMRQQASVSFAPLGLRRTETRINSLDPGGRADH